MNTSKKVYLVTGSAGFIAARVAAQLLGAGHQVVGIDNLNDYYDVRLKQHRLEQLVSAYPDRFRFEPIDLEDRAAIAGLLQSFSFDAVINLAARAGVRYSMVDPYVYMSTNAIGNLNLLEAMRPTATRKYILASTSSLYAGQPMPFVESLPVNSPISPYAASKKAAEAMAYAYHHLYEFDVSVVRYFTVYGPAGRPDMCVFRFIRWIDEGRPIQVFGDGEQSRDFTFVEDIAAGTIQAIRPVGYEVINLGGGEQPITLNRIIQKLERLLGKKARVEHHEFHKADVTSTWADISKAKGLLGWSPQINLDDGLAACVEWYDRNRPLSEQIILP